MVMSRKDYVKFARLLNVERNRLLSLDEVDGDRESRVNEVELLSHAISEVFEQDNPNYDATRFYQAVYNGKGI